MRVKSVHNRHMYDASDRGFILENNNDLKNSDDGEIGNWVSGGSYMGKSYSRDEYSNFYLSNTRSECGVGRTIYGI